VESTRADLGATLDEIEHRLTPKEVSRQATQWLSRSYDRKPVAWLTGIALSIVGGVAAILWAVTNDD
jgi:hypothetical protein